MSNSRYQAMAEEAILDHFRNPEHEPFHSDDLWHVIPDAHRGVISLAVMALVNKRLITGCGYRKSAIPSRKRSPSQEYRLTELGRDRIVGVGTESKRESGVRGPVNPTLSAHPGGARPTGAPTSKESGRDTTPPVPSASDQPGSDSGEDRAASQASSEPARLPGFDATPPSTHNPYSEAA